MKTPSVQGLARSIENTFTRVRDNALIKDVLSGKQAAFAKLMALYQNRVQAIGRNFFHNAADTEDFVQEVFLKVYVNLASFRKKSLFSTWLTRIAYTTAINNKKRKKDFESIADETELPALDRTPEEAEIRRLSAEAVKEAVTDLPPQYASCIDLYFFHDLAYDEIAKVTGLPLNTIKSHIFRAKKILREKLDAYR